MSYTEKQLEELEKQKRNYDPSNYNPEKFTNYKDSIQEEQLQYSPEQIEEFKNENPEYDEDDNGSFLVGANFISLIDDNETVISFVLISHNNNGGIYKCIYSDLK